MAQQVTVQIFVFLFGAAVGSFLNVVIHRLPREESVVSPPSRCPGCGSRIAWYDNIPILSWLLLRGKCRTCQSPISGQYPLVELLNGLLTFFLFLRYGPTPGFLVLFLLCSSLVAITFIDLEHQIIPDVISLPGILVGFACSSLVTGIGWKDSLIGILVGGGSLFLVAWGYELLTKKEGMGGGDIKLLAMLGAFFGWRAVLFIIFAASLIGSVVGITLMLVQKKDGKLAVPFGPFLAGGALLYIFFGPPIIRWYLGLGR
jgi:leader peptidase (prepilin peptidase)/N-methyltransferase